MTEENTQETEDDTFFEGMDETEIAETEAVDATPEPTVETETKVEAEAETETPDIAPTAKKDTSLVPKAAMLDERRKRQLLQEENERLRGQLPKQEDDVDFYESDQAEYDRNLRNKWESEMREHQQRVQSDNLNKSRSAQLELHDDYLEMEKIFELMTTSDESLIGDMLASQDAASFAYNKAKEYKASLIGGKPEVEPEVEVEKSEVDAPISLATATATASNTVQVEKEEDIDDVFADIKY